MSKSIVVSGPPAIGKTTVAKGLAKEFNLNYLSGGDILKELANEEGFSSSGDDWWDTEDGMKFLNQRKENPEFDKKVDKKLIELFEKGGTVITSYTLPWLINNGIKLWLDGSVKNSAKRMQNRDNMDEFSALEVVNKRFNENKLIYKNLYNFEFGDDLSVFDKIIQTDEKNADEVLEIAKSSVRELL
ncbi:MAG: AAA family ATPase [Candidatus Nitrosopelagicus sp.]|nr:AAA family ATPase [Candidatus Nitrosopelagicus sp.]